MLRPVIKWIPETAYDRAFFILFMRIDYDSQHLKSPLVDLFGFDLVVVHEKWDMMKLVDILGDDQPMAHQNGLILVE
ncbi:hypothetical protein SAY86_023928 [Trapa natans]|uniref:Uncharacterized protein n=1 Tax=Trapa natans TaxID=22666 RepID=A0AAN7M8X4_TRANT|nr:hypothetical protein SAY86_023928 [Trapa natans]